MRRTIIVDAAAHNVVHDADTGLFLCLEREIPDKAIDGARHARLSHR